MQTASRIDLSSILAERVDWRFKGFPPTQTAVTIGSIGEQGWNVLARDLPFPLLLLKESALDHNIALMARYCREHEVSLAPHGKTPVAPQIVARQMEAGAWGITAANLHQARVFRAFGVPRVLIANEVVETVALRWIAEEMDRDEGCEILFLVDSVAGARIVADAVRELAPSRPPGVLLEWGHNGARAGLRDRDQARRVCQVLRDGHVRVSGVEGYEGAITETAPHDPVGAIDRYLTGLRELTIELARDGVFDGRDEILVTAGGSMYMDRVVAVLGGHWDCDQPVRLILRSGAYVGHDSDQYARESGLGDRGGGPDRLRPALELWGVVLSRPERNLAIVGFGKRDASYDSHLPMPVSAHRGEAVENLRGRATVRKLNDQHAYMQVLDDSDVAVGDLVCCEISHACTAFDKWHLLPLVSDDYRVTGAIRTFF